MLFDVILLLTVTVTCFRPAARGIVEAAGDGGRAAPARAGRTAGATGGHCQLFYMYGAEKDYCLHVRSQHMQPVCDHTEKLSHLQKGNQQKD